MEDLTRPWWQVCTRETFEERVAEMEINVLKELLQDISAAIVVVESKRQTGSVDGEWLRRVRLAVGHMVERRRLVKAELAQRDVQNVTKNRLRKQKIVAEARAALGSGNVQKAVNIIIDWMDPDQYGS